MRTEGTQYRVVISCVIKEYADAAGKPVRNPYVDVELSRNLHNKFAGYFADLQGPEGLNVENHPKFMLNPSLADFLEVLRRFKGMKNSLMLILFSGNGAITSGFDIRDYDGDKPTEGDIYNEGMRFSAEDILWDADFNNELAGFRAENDIYFIPDCCYADGLTIREKMRREDWLRVKAQVFCLLPDNYLDPQSATNPYVLMAFDNLFPLVENRNVLYQPDKLHKYLNIFLEKDRMKVRMKAYNPRSKSTYPLFSVNNII